MTLYEQIILNLPEKLSDEEQEELLASLSFFLGDLQKEAQYLMLFAPYEKSDHYLTVFKVDEKGMKTAEKVIDFVIEHLGTIQRFDNIGGRFDFYVNKKMYSLFDYTSGVVDLR